MLLAIERYLSALEEHGRALADAADRIDLTVPCPDCPGWTVRDALEHTAMVHRWATRHVVEGLAAPDDDPPVPRLPDADLITYFREGHAALVAALHAAPDDLQAMRFLHDAPPARTFWARRQSHETAIHRSDVEVAAGSPPDYEATFATDGIDELLVGFYGRRRGRLRSDTTRTLGVRTSDTGRSWVLTIGPDGREVRRDADTDVADCRVEGPAAAIYPFLWNRTVTAPPRVEGDDTLIGLWHDLAHVTWS